MFILMMYLKRYQNKTGNIKIQSADIVDLFKSRIITTLQLGKFIVSKTY